jgi:hypothetical protein
MLRNTKLKPKQNNQWTCHAFVDSRMPDTGPMHEVFLHRQIISIQKQVPYLQLLISLPLLHFLLLKKQ